MVKLACFSSFLCNEKHIVNGNPWVQTQRGNVKPLPLTPTSPFLLSWEENRSDSRRSALTVQKPFIKPAICSLSARVEVEAADMRSPRISSINVHILQTANPPPHLVHCIPSYTWMPSLWRMQVMPCQFRKQKAPGKRGLSKLLWPPHPFTLAAPGALSRTKG